MLKLSTFSKLPFFFILITLSCSSKTIDKEQASKLPGIGSSTSVKSIYVECDEGKFNSIYKNYKENNYISVTISCDGKKWENVKLRVRGDSSRKLPKKSLKLKFSKKTPFLNGLSKINLNAEWYDKSYMTQYLSSYLMRKQGVHCFKSEHAFVYLNGRFHGIFLMIENVDKTFLSSRNLSTKETLYKATKDGATFNDTSEVYRLWEKKTNKKDLSREDLKQLIIDVNHLSENDAYDFFKKKFDYERLISAVALNILTGNKSTYYHNYYMLHNHDNDKWNMIPWDMDKTLMKELQNLHYARSTWSEGYNSNLADNPIPEFIFLNKRMKKDLKDKINEIVKTSFNPNHLDPIIDSLTTVLADQIKKDTTDNIQDIKTWENTVKEVKAFIQSKPSIILNQIENYPTPFIVFPAEANKVSWSKSDSETEVRYTVSLCQDYNFKKEKVYSFETDKTDLMFTGLPSGEYFFFVNAENSHGLTTGFRIKQKVLIK